MLSLFPEILFLTPFGPSILRIAAGIIFLLIAYTHFKRRDELSKENFVVIGSGIWIPVLTALVELTVGAGLVLGAYTQAAAIAGVLLSLKHFVWRNRYPRFFSLSRVTSALLCAICLSLILTGAGALAFDLPL